MTEQYSDSIRANLRLLPSIDRLLNEANAADLVAHYGREPVRDALRIVLDAAREWIRQGGQPPNSNEFFQTALEVLNRQFAPTFRPVINATGVILHPQLGRAPLSDAAQEAILAVASGYSTLDYRLDAGKRGNRETHVEELIKSLTGAEAALVVNTNAAAVMLTLVALAQERETILSRGQLGESDGGFRVPEIVSRSGAKLVEVGTTNCTTITDYVEAITPQTALLMRVQAAAFKQIGFTEQPPLKELVSLAREHNILVLDDLGSGTLLDTARYGLKHEPTVQESIEAGVDVVTFSGDKLLGGPQSGVIAGKKALIDKLKQHMLTRAMRIDKLRLAALIATLNHYRLGNVETQIPVWRMISMPAEQIRQRAESWAAEVGGDVIASDSVIGGSSLPDEVLPTFALALTVSDPTDVAARLRKQSQLQPVITRINGGRVLLDPRTVLLGQDAELLRTLRLVLGLSVL
ncbi:MAG: L-seryl-tRNA(Sec) selenium transferase [Anaerolineae bacterium]|nr:L-seryl-tRNA(Sec) selenium transferase [Anaerolineae bacterium]